MIRPQGAPSSSPLKVRDHYRRPANPVKTLRAERQFARALREIGRHAGHIIAGFPAGDPRAVPTITQLLRAYAEVPDAFTATPEERAAEPDSWWLKRIADPSGMSVAFGCFDGSTLVGTVTVEFSPRPKTRHKAHLIGMYVASEVRGRR